MLPNLAFSEYALMYAINKLIKLQTICLIIFKTN